MYPDEKYMNYRDVGDIKFIPLSSQTLTQLNYTNKNINFYVPNVTPKTNISKSNKTYNTTGSSYIRFFHAAQLNDSIDIYINSQLIKKNFIYASMTSYLEIPNGTYTIRVYKSGTNQNPLLILKTSIEKNHYYTNAIIENGNRLSILMLKNENKIIEEDKNTHIRLINLIPFSPLLNMSVYNNKKFIMDNVEYGETTKYLNIVAYTYNLEVFSADNSLRKSVMPKAALLPGCYYTLFAIGNIDLPKPQNLLLYKDM